MLKKDPTIAVAYFYFDFNDLEKQDCRGLVSSLVFQLGTQYEVCLSYLTQQRSSYPSGEHPTYEKLLLMLSRLLGLSGPTFLVIDALDECPEPERDNGLASFLEHLCQVDSGEKDLHLLVTSRPESDIQGHMSRFATHSLSFHDCVPHQAELKDFISAHISENKSYRWSDELKKQVQEIVCEKSNGMYVDRYAHLRARSDIY